MKKISTSKLDLYLDLPKPMKSFKQIHLEQTFFNNRYRQLDALIPLKAYSKNYAAYHPPIE